MNFEEFLKKSIEDLSGFFVNKDECKISITKEGARNHIAVRGQGEDKKIVISNDMASFKIDTPIKYLISLIVAGHEFAHCLCEHNKFKDTRKIESVAIEGFADYFGARISFTLLNFGKNNFENFSNFYGGMPFSDQKFLNLWLGEEEIFKCTGKALNEVNSMFYKGGDASGRYPSSEVRILTFIAGVNSFFYRYRAKLSQEQSLKIFLGIWRNLDIQHSCTYGKDDHIEEIEPIHSSIQGDDLRISSGLTAFYENLIGTEFKLSNQVKRKKIINYLKNFESWEPSLVGELMEKLSSDLVKLSEDEN